MIFLFPDGQVEVANSSGQIGYHWANAYSAYNYFNDTTSCPYTRANWRGMAKRDGTKLVFCSCLADAKERARMAAKL